MIDGSITAFFTRLLRYILTIVKAARSSVKKGRALLYGYDFNSVNKLEKAWNGKGEEAIPQPVRASKSEADAELREEGENQ